MRWFEIVAAGDEDAWERLVAAKEAATGQRAVRGAEMPVRPESLSERLHELLHARSEHVVFAPEALSRALLGAAGGSGAASGLRLAGLREVSGGRFDFTVEAFAEPVAKQIRETLATPPAGVEVHVTRDDEERNPEAGEPGRVELYAPLHCYAYRAWGTVSGPLPGLLEIHRRLHELPFVYEGKIELAARPADPAEIERRPGG